MNIRSKIQSLITAINLKTGKSDTNLTDAVQTVLDDHISLRGVISRNITSVEIPADVTSIGTMAFAYCDKLSSISINNAITEIKPSAFTHATRLATISFGIGVTVIQNNAFEYCSALTSVTFPAQLQTLKDWSFRYCSGLTTVKFLGTPTTVQNAFVNSNNISDIYVPWSEGAVANAPWGATNATIHYNTTFDANGNVVS